MGGLSNFSLMSQTSPCLGWKEKSLLPVVMASRTPVREHKNLKTTDNIMPYGNIRSIFTKSFLDLNRKRQKKHRKATHIFRQPMCNGPFDIRLGSKIS